MIGEKVIAALFSPQGDPSGKRHEISSAVSLQP
ncbi:hypothetical protein FHU10_0773 [Serratia fonticola]|uniref:Uncharacterized protein n=1 Tax=Serratia fonticola TaxID=47917 RepID=A0A559T162_SERFO|nr:hypothetical protein FHU11_4373 [Serratia fonticola]TVZ68343.1 hypothetical protein FHU10_0773 [Serratia fonticola]